MNCAEGEIPEQQKKAVHVEYGRTGSRRREELLLNMGPQHPSTHGVLRVVLELDGERIVKATPDLGYLHRGVEKLCEGLAYMQIIPHTDRLDYVCAMSNNYAYVRAVEKLLRLRSRNGPNTSGPSSPKCSGSSGICFGWAPRRWISAP